MGKTRGFVSHPGVLCVGALVLFLMYSWSAVRTIDKRIQAEHREARAHALRQWADALHENALYRTASCAIMRPSEETFRTLAEMFPDREANIQYRTVVLYATLADPLARAEDRMRVWRAFRDPAPRDLEAERELLVTRYEMRAWTEALHVNFFSPDLSSGVRDALSDDFVFGGPRYREDPPPP